MTNLEKLPPGHKIWIELCRDVPHEGYRARLQATSDTGGRVPTPDSFLGRWRYIDALADVADYLVNLGPTHYLRLTNSVSPLLIAFEFDVLKRLSNIRSRLRSTKSESLWIAGEAQAEIEERLLRWDGRPSWLVTLSRAGDDAQCTVRAEPKQAEVESITGIIQAPNEAAFLNLLGHLDPLHLVRRGPASTEIHSLVIGVEENLRPVAALAYRELVEQGTVVFQLRPTTSVGVRHRLGLGSVASQVSKP